jgi:hypothetical protein
VLQRSSGSRLCKSLLGLCSRTTVSRPYARDGSVENHRVGVVYADCAQLDWPYDPIDSASSSVSARGRVAAGGRREDDRASVRVRRMATLSGSPRRTGPQPFAQPGQRDPAPVVVRFECPICGADHARTDCRAEGGSSCNVARARLSGVQEALA